MPLLSRRSAAPCLGRPLTRLVAVPLLLCAALLMGCERGAAVGEPAAPDTTLLGGIEAPVPGTGTLRLIRLRARGARSEFEPARIAAAPGDVLRFVQTTRQPAGVRFDTAQTPAGGAAFLRAAGAARGVLLTRPGQSYDVVLSGAPPGRYVFEAVPGDARGVLQVEAR